MMKKITLLLSALVSLFMGNKANAQCAAGEVEIFIEVVTDGWGYEAYWELNPNGDPCGTNTIGSGGNATVGCAGEMVRAQDPGGYANSTTILEGPFCLMDGVDYTLNLVDDWGDGGITYNVISGGATIASITDDNDGDAIGESFTFTAVGPPASDLTIASVTASSGTYVTPINGGNYTVLDFSERANMTVDIDVQNTGANPADSLFLTYFLVDDINAPAAGVAFTDTVVPGTPLAPTATYSHSFAVQDMDVLFPGGPSNVAYDLYVQIDSSQYNQTFDAADDSWFSFLISPIESYTVPFSTSFEAVDAGITTLEFEQKDWAWHKSSTGAGINPVTYTNFPPHDGNTYVGFNVDGAGFSLGAAGDMFISPEMTFNAGDILDFSFFMRSGFGFGLDVDLQLLDGSGALIATLGNAATTPVDTFNYIPFSFTYTIPTTASDYQVAFVKNAADFGVIDLFEIDYSDQDADGFTSDVDCDDNNAAINPGATEVCDGVDNNCDGNIDEGLTFVTYYADADADGYGDASTDSTSCAVPTGYVTDNTDCDDTNAAINPGATEVCDGVDNNCDGNIDEGVQTTYYADADADGYGDAASTMMACSAPAGFVTDNTDCDDTNAAINPGATEIPSNGTDEDCDGFDAVVDLDNDTYDNTVDCDDNNAAINPGATEVCDGVDNNCDGNIDEGFTINTYYADTDADGFGDASSTMMGCSAPAGFVTDNTDCDDTNAAINPGATEVCDGIDNNCDGNIDEGVQTAYYPDVDMDGFGDMNATATMGCSAPAGMVADNTDFDDSNVNSYPGAPEVCDGDDNNNNGNIDEGVQTAYYADADMDGFGDVNGTATMACSAPAGMVADNTDFDDSNVNSYPGAPEVCDGDDNNNNGTIDEGVQNTYYADTDADGFGDAASSIMDCATTAPAGYVADGTDCDDTNASINPSATEILGNGIDEDCNGTDSTGTAISTITFAEALNVYPNPVVADVNASFEFANATDVEMSIVSINGQVIETRTFTSVYSVVENFSAASYSNGVYMIKVQTEEGVATQRFVVSK